MTNPEPGRIYQGDCIEIMRSWPSDFVDMIWTDPPYGHANQNGDLASSRVGVKGGRQRAPVVIQNDDRESTRRVVDGMLTEAARVLKADCCCCCCCCCGGGPTPAFAWTADRMDRDGMAFFHAVVWDKSARGNGLGWRYRRNYEFVMVAHRKGGKLMWADDAVAVPNIVRTPPVPNDDHPTTKPVDLVGHFIEWHTKPGDLILDPFCGSGTTLVAAERLGRRWIGIELDPAHVATAQARVDAERAQGKLL